MTLSRRRALATGVSALAAITVLPWRVRAMGHADGFPTANGEVKVYPISHASFVMETPGMVIHVDPVGEAEAYADLPAPDLILITHEHGDHYKPETLAALVTDGTKLITNPAVYEKLPEDLKARATAIGNGERTEAGAISIEAIPAYNLTEDRLQYHPQGRDNGYVLGIDGLTVYVAGDTEDIPEMRALSGIDVAFLPMNLPYTMTVDQAASAVAEFKPAHVYPYHYGDSDVDRFAQLVSEQAEGVEVVMGEWYPDETA